MTDAPAELEAAAGGPAPAPAPPEKPRGRWEFEAYLLTMVSWFSGFGLQMVLFPYLTVNVLHASAPMLGLVQMSLSGPSLVLLLVAGAVAERVDGRRMLIILHLAAAVPALILAGAMAQDLLAFWMLPVYGIVMGVIGAFMMPARDAILYDVIQRRAAVGSSLNFQNGVAYASLGQFAGQLCGLLLGGFAASFGPARLLAVQAVVLALGALSAAMLQHAGPRNTVARVRGLRAAWLEVREGLSIVKASPVLSALVLQMFGVGIFVIGSFLVILPILSRDIYGGGAGALRDLFVGFWGGAFISSAILSRMKPAQRPGLWLLAAQGLGTVCTLGIALHPPFWAFLGIVVTWGLGAGVSMTMSRAIVQEAAPRAAMARVMSIFQLGFMGGAPIGSILMGFAVQFLGPGGAPIVPTLGLLAVIGFAALKSPLPRITRDAIRPS